MKLWTDDRRTDDGLTPEHGYTISSPCEPEGSGESKNNQKERKRTPIRQKKTPQQQQPVFPNMKIIGVTYKTSIAYYHLLKNIVHVFKVKVCVHETLCSKHMNAYKGNILFSIKS